MVSWKGKYLCILFSAVVLCVLCLTETAACAQARHALVVGIGNYPENSGWSRISGDKDAGLVKSMLAHNGFPEQDIIVLKDADAKKAAIRDAFAELAVLLRKGDVVYVHFPVTDSRLRTSTGMKTTDWMRPLSLMMQPSLM